MRGNNKYRKILILKKRDIGMEKEVAEFVGIMLGDGNLAIYNCKSGNKIKKQHRIRISLDSRNKEYIHYVSDLMKKVLDVEPRISYKKNENAVDIGTYQIDKFLYLKDKIGLITSPKWDKMKIPEAYLREELIPFVLKGLFDTDGSLTVFNNNGVTYPRIEIKICPSPAQKQVVDILNRLDINYKIQKLDKEKIRIRISGVKELREWFNLVGSSNQLHIRKAESFLNNKL